MTMLAMVADSHRGRGIPSSRRPLDPAAAITTGAIAIDQHDMIDHCEGRRNQFPQVLKASFELVQLAALQAVKMMMMGLATHLVTWRRAWHFHRDQPAFVAQSLYGAIDIRSAKVPTIRLM